MNSRGETTALEKLLRPLPHGMSKELARALLDLKADDETQGRYEILAEKRTEGNLSPPEADELEAIVRANTLIGLLKADAHSLLAHSKPS